jgi:hypothetical protein
LDVDPLHFLGIRNPDTIVCSNMKHGLATPHSARERLQVGEIAGDDLTVDTG